jgi:predicted Zn-dependent peptidase
MFFVGAQDSVHREMLSNGLVLITEPMEQVRSVSVGIWLRSGSRREPAELNGITHFIEHMVFKGTERRSAEEIARVVDGVGGLLDAFTAKEMTCFNVKVLDEHLPLAFDVLSDLVRRPRFAAEDVRREKSVVLEEIKMDHDNPDYVVHEVFTQGFWRGHPLGLPIIGTPETVRGFEASAVADCFQRWYTPSNMVIAAAGNVTPQQMRALVEGEFGSLPPGERVPQDAPPAGTPHLTVHPRELEQVHLCLGVRAYPMAHEKRFVLAVLNTALGGGTSSRLFQSVREREGLAYAVFSDVSLYHDAGLLTVYAATSREHTEQLIRTIAAEFHRMKREPMPAEELRRVKDNLRGSLLLGLESSGARMSHLARQELYFGRFATNDELLAAIEAVTAEEVQALAQEFFQTEQIAATLAGDARGFPLTRDLLAC